jgi:hypothetical protein
MVAGNGSAKGPVSHSLLLTREKHGKGLTLASSNLAARCGRLGQQARQDA